MIKLMHANRENLIYSLITRTTRLCAYRIDELFRHADTPTRTHDTNPQGEVVVAYIQMCFIVKWESVLLGGFDGLVHK